jgi:hypothetical protein
MPTIPERLRAIADAIENGSRDRVLALGLSKITREFLGQSTDDTNLNIESVFGAITKKGMVRVEVNNEWAMLAPDQARVQAGYLLEAAGSAEFDEFVYTKLAPQIGLDQDGAGQLLMHFREWRKR